MNRWTLKMRSSELESEYEGQNNRTNFSILKIVTVTVLLTSALQMIIVFLENTHSTSVFLYFFFYFAAGFICITLSYWSIRLFDYAVLFSLCVYAGMMVWSNFDEGLIKFFQYDTTITPFVRGFYLCISICSLLLGSNVQLKIIYLFLLLFLIVFSSSQKPLIDSFKILPSIIALSCKVYMEDRSKRSTFLLQKKDLIWDYLVDYMLPNSLILTKYNETTSRFELFSQNKKAREEFGIENTEQFHQFCRHIVLNSYSSHREMKAKLEKCREPAPEETLYGQVRIKFEREINKRKQATIEQGKEARRNTQSSKRKIPKEETALLGGSSNGPATENTPTLKQSRPKQHTLDIRNFLKRQSWGFMRKASTNDANNNSNVNPNTTAIPPISLQGTSSEARSGLNIPQASTHNINSTMNKQSQRNNYSAAVTGDAAPSSNREYSNTAGNGDESEDAGQEGVEHFQGHLISEQFIAVPNKKFSVRIITFYLNEYFTVISIQRDEFREKFIQNVDESKRTTRIVEDSFKLLNNTSVAQFKTLRDIYIQQSTANSVTQQQQQQQQQEQNQNQQQQPITTSSTVGIGNSTTAAGLTNPNSQNGAASPDMLLVQHQEPDRSTTAHFDQMTEQYVSIDTVRELIYRAYASKQQIYNTLEWMNRKKSIYSEARQKLRMEEMVTGLKLVFESLVKEKALQLSTRIQDVILSNSSIYSDPRVLNQLLYNLLSFAIDKSASISPSTLKSACISLEITQVPTDSNLIQCQIKFTSSKQLNLSYLNCAELDDETEVNYTDFLGVKVAKHILRYINPNGSITFGNLSHPADYSITFFIVTTATLNIVPPQNGMFAATQSIIAPTIMSRTYANTASAGVPYDIRSIYQGNNTHSIDQENKDTMNISRQGKKRMSSSKYNSSMASMLNPGAAGGAANSSQLDPKKRTSQFLKVADQTQQIQQQTVFPTNAGSSNNISINNTMMMLNGVGGNDFQQGFKNISLFSSPQAGNQFNSIFQQVPLQFVPIPETSVFSPDSPSNLLHSGQNLVGINNLHYNMNLSNEESYRASPFETGSRRKISDQFYGNLIKPKQIISQPKSDSPRSKQFRKNDMNYNQSVFDRKENSPPQTRNQNESEFEYEDYVEGQNLESGMGIAGGSGSGSGMQILSQSQYQSSYQHMLPQNKQKQSIPSKYLSKANTAENFNSGRVDPNQDQISISSSSVVSHQSSEQSLGDLEQHIGGSKINVPQFQPQFESLHSHGPNNPNEKKSQMQHIPDSSFS